VWQAEYDSRSSAFHLCVVSEGRVVCSCVVGLGFSSFIFGPPANPAVVSCLSNGFLCCSLCLSTFRMWFGLSRWLGTTAVNRNHIRGSIKGRLSPPSACTRSVQNRLSYACVFKIMFLKYAKLTVFLFRMAVEL
jgi:hypothetical protein